MIEKKTVLQQIEVQPDGFVGVRLQFLILEDGKIISSAWHRTSLPPGVDVEAQMAAVGAHLAAMNKEPIGEGCMARLRAHVALAHTEEAVAAYAARVAEEEKSA